MKNVRVIIRMIFFMMAIATSCYAAEGPTIVKEKKVSAHYTVQTGDKLVVDNVYGMVHVNTWDKNEVNIDITVSAKANTEDKAAEMLGKVSFKQEGGHRIYYKTVMSPVSTLNDKASPTINYVITMPKKMTIDLTNKYGDIYLDDVDGTIQMSLKYGALSAKKISGTDNNIQIAYGSGDVGMIDAGNIDISYSNLSVEKAKNLHIKNVFGKLDINAIQDLGINQKYGDLDLGTTGSISGNVDYANITIDELTTSADLTLKYCSKANFRSITGSAKDIRITSGYGSLYLNVLHAANLTIDAEAVYGQVNWPSGSESKDVKTGNFNSSYNGRVGTGKGTMKVSVKYGNIFFK